MISAVNSKYIWLNGEMLETSRAAVPFLTVGLHYGVGVFEGIRAYDTAKGPAVFRLRDHLVRMEGSAKILGFRDVPYSVDELIAATVETVRVNGFGACYIRPLVYLAEGGWNLTIDTGKPHVGIAVWEQTVYAGRDLSKGVKATVTSFTRSHPNANMTKAKVCGNYANSVLAKTEAFRNGFDEAIMLDPEGYVAECTGANLLLVRGGRLISPPLDAILDGVTRNTLMQIAGAMGIEVEERRISRDSLYLADEAFVCGTAAEVLPIVDIDRRPVHDGRPGPVTQRLQAAYMDAVHGRHSRSEEWLEYVPTGVAAAR
jgi:branched-chain amino acid aminotransferase